MNHFALTLMALLYTASGICYAQAQHLSSLDRIFELVNAHPVSYLNVKGSAYSFKMVLKNHKENKLTLETVQKSEDGSQLTWADMIYLDNIRKVEIKNWPGLDTENRMDYGCSYVLSVDFYGEKVVADLVKPKDKKDEGNFEMCFNDFSELSTVALEIKNIMQQIGVNEVKYDINEPNY